MNDFSLKEFVDQSLFYISSHLGVTLPRILAGIIGLSVFLVICVRFWERKSSIAKALLLGVPSLLLTAFALNPHLLHLLTTSGYLNRIRVLLFFLSLFVFSITFESIRISRLKERYALLWLATSAMVLLSALFPNLIFLLTGTLGIQYVTAIVGVVFTFLLLVAFHYSIALSRLEEDRAKIAQHCAILETRIAKLETLVLGRPPHQIIPGGVKKRPEQKMSVAEIKRRPVQGGRFAVWILIAGVTLAMLIAGWRNQGPMIGDEVTHYFMLTHQAEQLPAPTFQAVIPNAFSDTAYVRNYPHPNGWHYLGAVLYRFLPGGPGLVQCYQLLYLVQLLWAAYAWALYRRGPNAYSPYLYLLVLASLPMNLMFGTAFYQDVPMAAQALTAFYFLDRRRYGTAGFFLALGMWIKVNGILFVPPFLFAMLWLHLRDSRQNGLTIKKRSLLLVRQFVFPVFWITLAFGWNSFSLNRYGDAEYLPVSRLRSIVKFVTPEKPKKQNVLRETAVNNIGSTGTAPSQNKKRRKPLVVNHPGDLRNPVNLIMYGGGIIYLVALVALVGLVRPRSERLPAEASRKHAWPVWVGIYYLVLVGVLVSKAPDIRFFLPGIPFLFLPLAKWAHRAPKIRACLILLTVAGLLQVGFVIRTFSSLRHVPEGVSEGIRFLKENPPDPRAVMMYPEGNYRLFPVRPDWYLGNTLSAFWGLETSEKIRILQQRGLGGVVVKHHLIAPVRDPKRDLGSYPPEFVRELEEANQFERVFKNSELSIFYLNEDLP